MAGLAQAAEGGRDRLRFLPERVGGYWTQIRSQAVQFDVVAANRRDRRLFIGEAKWGDEPAPREVLVDLLERSQKMPRVAEGWPTQYAVFA